MYCRIGNLPTGSQGLGCHDYQVFGFTVNEVALVSSSLAEVATIFATFHNQVFFSVV